MISDTTQPARNASGLYRTIWRWHFYAGLFCIPVMLTLSLSGAIYLFKPQIDDWTDSSYRSLTVGAERQSANALIAAAVAAVPGSRFASYQLPDGLADAVVIGVLQEGVRKLVTVHPYTLAVLHIGSADEQLTTRVKHLHGELLAGTPGSVLVELAGCWAIVLICSGLYLWWPRQASGLGGVLYPRLSRGRRAFWRDLHAVTGFWVAGLVLFLLVSGLPWATVWGGAFKELRSHIGQTTTQDWTLSSREVAHHWQQVALATADLSETLLAAAGSLHFAPPVELSIEHPAGNIWLLSSNHQNRTLRVEASLDGDTGQVLRITRFDDKPLIDRMIGIGISIHEGQLFGWANQALGLLAAAGTFLISISGVMMWWNRRPAGRLGAPAAVPRYHVDRVVTAIVLLLALLLPLFAISLAVVGLIEWLVGRVAPARRSLEAG